MNMPCIWGQQKDLRRVNWLRWEVLCKDKASGGLGLRRLADFNFTLLAKQGWRLLRDDSSLLARTLKARYFPSSTFMQAKVGYNLSFTWRSVLDGRMVLQHGLFWMVGNGSRICIWDDPWILNGGDGPVSLDRVDSVGVSVVSDLIDLANWSWDLPRLREFFPEFVVDIILAIPVGDPELADELIWHFNKNGFYSVRSGYVEGTGSEVDIDLSGQLIIWSLIWDLDVPPKVKFFLWKLVHGILPTSINPVSRLVDVDPLCQQCDREIETEDHLFHGCEWVAAFWELNSADFMRFILVDVVRPFSEWVLTSLASIPEETQRALFSVQLWSIWLSRN
ncbi:hypothetical protein ACS0TY_024714 [Phlomoides rotata]